ncbi:MAG: hypothetical protein PVJ84_09450 [Desulfobacteraceae bacterium]|jgi:hypothetical protein
MKLSGYISICLLLLVLGPCWAHSGSLDVDSDNDSGAIYPLSLDAVSGFSDGSPFISVSSAVQDSVVDTSAMTQQELDSTLFSTSYSRGAGTSPDSCPEGFGEIFGFCAEICPTGYTAAIGACWEDCPDGWTDMGLFCANWGRFWFSGKDIFAQEFTSTICADGLVEEEGLCYVPCEDGFTGSGSACISDLDDDNSYSALSTQISEQHAQALATATAGGIELPDGVAPELQAIVMFAPVVCEAESLVGSLGFIPDPVESITDTVNDAIEESLGDWATVDTGSAWFIPSIANTILFDLSAEAVCEDDGQIAQATLSIEPSITVQVQSELFDTALHDITGVDLGIMSISIYELIPFRIYGTAGATVSIPTQLTSVIDRSLPALIIDGQQYANQTALTVDPAMELWLSTEAYLRVTNFVSFLPDLLQLGAEFNLDVLDVTMPYSRQEGLRSNENGYEIYKEESLTSELSAGAGSFDAFLRILGIDIDIFGGADDITWEGYQRYDELIYNESSTDLSL